MRPGGKPHETGLVRMHFSSPRSIHFSIWPSRRLTATHSSVQAEAMHSRNRRRCPLFPGRLPYRAPARPASIHDTQDRVHTSKTRESVCHISSIARLWGAYLNNLRLAWLRKRTPVKLICHIFMTICHTFMPYCHSLRP